MIDGSLYETALFWMGVPTATYLASKQVPRRMGTENGNLAPYKAFEASDGWVVIAPAMISNSPGLLRRSAIPNGRVTRNFAPTPIVSAIASASTHWSPTW